MLRMGMIENKRMHGFFPYFSTPALQYSWIPTLQYSNTPVLQHSSFPWKRERDARSTNRL